MTNGLESAAGHGIPLLGLILDSNVIIAAKRKRQTIEELLTSAGQTFGEIEIAIPAVTLAEKLSRVCEPTRHSQDSAKTPREEQPYSHLRFGSGIQ
jgi:predicted nucleic acid-binding protein